MESVFRYIMCFPFIITFGISLFYFYKVITADPPTDKLERLKTLYNVRFKERPPQGPNLIDAFKPGSISIRGLGYLFMIMLMAIPLSLSNIWYGVIGVALAIAAILLVYFFAKRHIKKRLMANSIEQRLLDETIERLSSEQEDEYLKSYALEVIERAHEDMLRNNITFIKCGIVHDVIMVFLIVFAATLYIPV